MVSVFGHALIRNHAAAGQRTVDLGGKMLRDEHLSTLEAEIRSGRFRASTSLSLNANPLITTLPSLDGMDALQRLSLIGASSLTSLPDLSRLTSLELVKLEGCAHLRALPPLPQGVEWVDAHLPPHLCSVVPSAGGGS